MNKYISNLPAGTRFALIGLLVVFIYVISVVTLLHIKNNKQVEVEIVANKAQDYKDPIGKLYIHTSGGLIIMVTKNEVSTFDGVILKESKEFPHKSKGETILRQPKLNYIKFIGELKLVQ